MTTPDETRSFDKGRVDIAKESRELEWMMVQKWNLVLVTLVIFHLDTMRPTLCSGRLHRHGDIRQKMINQIHLYNVACGRT
jgi:hypothetical protein